MTTFCSLTKENCEKKRNSQHFHCYTKILQWLLKFLEPPHILRTTVKFTALLYSAAVLWSVVSDSLRLHGLEHPRLLCLRDFSGKPMRVGCHLLLQGIFPTQRSNLHLLHLLHYQVEYLPLHHLGCRPLW